MQIVSLCSDKTIVVIPRTDVDEGFLSSVSAEGKARYSSYRGYTHTRWNQADTTSEKNAIPHVHPYMNCSLAPKPTETPTAFFSHAVVRSTLEKMSIDDSCSVRIRHALVEILQRTPNTAHPRALFNRLDDFAGSDESPPLGDFIQDLHRRILTAGGLYEVDLSQHGAAGVIIDPDAGHGRSMVHSQKRKGEPTVWKYFGSPVSIRNDAAARRML